MDMTQISPAVKDRFDSLSAGLQDMILKKNRSLNTMQDLIQVLEEIVKEEEAKE